MKQTNRAANAPFDWALIRWARLREEAGDVATPRLDPEKDERGRLRDPRGCRLERAEAILADSGVSGDVVRRRARRVWLASLLLVVALGACVFPFARADSILGNGVNLAGPFAFFLLGQIFFLALSLFFAVLAAIQAFVRVFKRDFGRQSFAEKLVERLGGLVGWCAIDGIKRCVRLVGVIRASRFFGKKNADSAAPPPAEKGVGAKFFDWLFENPRFICFWGCFLSHLFWASCSVCVLAILVVKMQGNRYDYCWRTSLEDSRVVKKCVDFLGVPVAAIGGEIPTEDDVERLFAGGRDLGAALDKAAKFTNSGPAVVVVRADGEHMTAQIRTRWSHFLLGVVLIWCVAPRCLLALAYYCLLRVALRELRPDLRDPFYRDLIEREEAYATTTRAAVVQDDFDDAPAPPKPAAPVVKIALPSQTTVSPQILQPAPKPAPVEILAVNGGFSELECDDVPEIADNMKTAPREESPNAATVAEPEPLAEPEPPQIAAPAPLAEIAEPE
ncbi:MAG: DUF2868 domain-containing protein, partial [Thermoguttaceae bacterium]|nr:DUF2868 domain-containing protein [Thermoguttaceae bacterium]